jgi:hypothetical protein
MTAPEHLIWVNSTVTLPSMLRQTRGRLALHLPSRATAGVPGARGLR